MIRDLQKYKRIKTELRGVTEHKAWFLIPEEDNPENYRKALFKPTEEYTPKGYREPISTQAHFSEELYSQICRELLDFPCAKIERATYEGREGCLSYNVIDDIKNNNEEKTKFALYEMPFFISGVRPHFDPITLRDRDTGECFSIEMILEALEESSNTEKQFEVAKKYVIELCLIDSLTNYIDRHSGNIAYGYDNINGNIFPTGVYDNGGCLGLGLPKDKIQKVNQSKEEMEFLRQISKSRIGTSTRQPVVFDTIETLIFNNYHDTAYPMAKRIIEKITPTNIDKILANPDYDDLDPEYKLAVKNQLIFNKENMMKRLSKALIRKRLESLFDNAHKIPNLSSRQEVKKKSRLEQIQEQEQISLAQINYTIGRLLRIDLKKDNIFTTDDLDIIIGISKSPNSFCKDKISNLDQSKNIAKWTYIYNKILDNIDETIPEEARRKMLNEEFLNRLNFYKEDLSEIDTISRAKLKNNTREGIRQFIYGQQGIGTHKLDSYLAMQKEILPSDEFELLEKIVTDILEKEAFIREKIGGTRKERFNFLKKIGLNNDSDIYRVVYSALDKLGMERKYFYEEELEKYFIDQAIELFKDTKTFVNGKLIDNKQIEKIKKHTHILPNSKSYIKVKEKTKNIQNAISALGIDYTIVINEITNKNNEHTLRSLSIISKNEESLPQSIYTFFDELEEKLIKRVEERYEGNEEEIETRKRRIQDSITRQTKAGKMNGERCEIDFAKAGETDLSVEKILGYIEKKLNEEAEKEIREKQEGVTQAD